MRLELQFNPTIYKQQNQLNFKKLWKKNLNDNKKNVPWMLLSFVLGVIQIFLDSELAFLCMGFGIHFSIRFIDTLYIHRREKKKHLSHIDSEIEKYQKAEQVIIWEFHDEHFYYSDYKVEGRIKWMAFEGYKVIENTLFIEMYAKVGLSYILSKSEVGEQEWNQILNLIKEKIKK